MRRFANSLLILLAILAHASLADAHDPGLSTLHVELSPEAVTATLHHAPDERFTTNRVDSVVSVWMGDTRIGPAVRAEAFSPNTIREVFPTILPAEGGQLRVRADALEALPAGHRQFARVLDASGEVLAERMLTQQASTFEIEIPTDAVREIHGSTAFLPPMVRLGVRHIATGFDHLLFLGVLLLGCKRYRAAAWIITGFTVAHSITLALATYDLIAVDPDWVEPAIAASIVIGALLNLVDSPSAQARTGIAFAFGLIHGLGFAGLLEELAAASERIDGRLLFEFNLGVEVGQLAFALPLLAALRAFGRTNPLAIRIPHYGSLAIAGVGAFWFFERIDVLG